ncbi:MAG: hypothetical protein EOM19_06655 [Candidatus Moranbacteria bacterium]|nr:hypothetical protein [Candidatus Moranbacteria bacterium]
MKLKTFSFPNPKTENVEERFVQRFFEMLPGICTWSILIGMIVLSFFLPVWVAVFVIAFDIYWVYKSFFVSSYTLAAYRRLRQGLSIHWDVLLSDIDTLKDSLEQRKKVLSKERLGKNVWYEKFFRKRSKKYCIQKNEIALLENITLPQEKIMRRSDIIQVIMFPTATEGPEIIEPAIEAIKASSFPNNQLIILLATEENENEEKREYKVRILKEKFRGTFLDFLVTTHKVKSDEMKCKASNATYAVKQLRIYLDAKSIEYTRVILSNFDCDTVCHPQYLSALAFLYATEENRLRFAYQPLPMYNNNIWDTNAFVRVVVFNSTFWHMFQSTRSHMVTFSSHSEPLDTIIRLNYWPVNMISEDSIIYWKGFSRFHSEYRTKIVPLPVSMDAALANTYWETLLNQYKQLRRWAYGAENIPVVMRALLPDKKISFFRKMQVLFELLEGHVLWAIAPIILGFVGWMPLLFGGAEFKEGVLAHNLPFITSYLMTIAMAGLLIIAGMNFLLLPPKPKRYSRWRYVNLTLQWFLVPIMAPFIIALPAIDAQTRLLFGKYFGSFWVTEKIRKTDRGVKM